MNFIARKKLPSTLRNKTASIKAKGEYNETLNVTIETRYPSNED